MAEISPTNPALTAQIGTHVVVELVSDSGVSERVEFDIVPDPLADFASGLLGEGTPLAKAIWRKPAGASLPYRQGDIVRAPYLTRELGWDAAMIVHPTCELPKSAVRDVQVVEVRLLDSLPDPRTMPNARRQLEQYQEVAAAEERAAAHPDDAASQSALGGLYPPNRFYPGSARSATP